MTREQKLWALAVAAGLAFIVGIAALTASQPPPTAAELREEERDARIIRDRMLGATPIVIEPPSSTGRSK